MKFIFFFVCFLLAGCGSTLDGEPDSGWDPDGDIYPPDFWQPGDAPPAGCTGSGGADGGDGCLGAGLSCSDSPCVHGTCVVEQAAPDRCACDPGYAGEICDRCAADYVAVGLDCVLAGGCADSPCIYGTCRPLDEGDFQCDCEAAYTGRLCDRCAEGYHAEGLRCVPD